MYAIAFPAEAGLRDPLGKETVAGRVLMVAGSDRREPYCLCAELPTEALLL